MALILGPPTPEKFLEARRHVQNALKLDQIPEALALQADLLVSDYLNKWNNTTIADVDAAEALIAAALFIDSNVWMAYYARGFTNSVRGQHQASFNDFNKVTQLNGAWKGRAYAQMGNQKLFLGDPKQAVQYGLQAIKVSPNDPSIGVFNWVVGRAYFSLPAPDYVNAVKYLYQSVQVRPNLWFSQAWLIAAYWLNADKTNAPAALTQFQAAFPYTLQWITDYYATEARYQNPTIQTAVKTMLQALHDAGLTSKAGHTQQSVSDKTTVS